MGNGLVIIVSLCFRSCSLVLVVIFGAWSMPGATVVQPRGQDSKPDSDGIHGTGAKRSHWQEQCRDAHWPQESSFKWLTLTRRD